ncbi:MAG: TRAP transporter small permease [Planctomycetaceae bacterium]|nr:TRAP transporter small permease [Planctomycetaceae bacterium]
MKTIDKLFTSIEETLVVVGLAFMTVMNFINVVSRYLFTNSFSFTEELTVTVFVWITMLGVAVGFKRYAHLGMSYFVDMMPRNLRAAMALFSMACSLVMVFVMGYISIEMIQSQIALNARTPAMEMPVYVQSLAIPIGAIFVLVRIIQSGLIRYRRIRAGDDNAATTEEAATAEGGEA